jgi:GNAT superfamily N-acetyltransferase
MSVQAPSRACTPIYALSKTDNREMRLVNIRAARKGDAQATIPLFITVHSGFANILTGAMSEQDVLAALIQFFQSEENRLSYQNTLVAEGEQGIVGLLLAYHGSLSADLDRPLIEYMCSICKNPALTLDREAGEDEFYIDTVVVAPAFANQGIGTALMGAVEEWARRLHYNKLALNVYQENEGAYRLYQRLDYAVNEEIYIAHRRYFHMVKYLS